MYNKGNVVQPRRLDAVDFAEQNSLVALLSRTIDHPTPFDIQPRRERVLRHSRQVLEATNMWWHGVNMWWRCGEQVATHKN